MMTAARSFLSQAKRNTTFLCLPDCRVDGIAPARKVSDSASKGQARQSPISASSAAARTRPDRGRAVKMAASGWVPSRSASPSNSSIWARTVSRAAASPRVTVARATPGTVSPAGRGQTSEQLGCGLAPRIAHAAQECGEGELGQPGRLGHRGEAARKASAMGLSTSLNSVAAPGKLISRLARSSLASATRVATSDLRARLTTRQWSGAHQDVAAPAGARRCAARRRARRRRIGRLCCRPCHSGRGAL